MPDQAVDVMMKRVLADHQGISVARHGELFAGAGMLAPQEYFKALSFEGYYASGVSA